MDAAASISSFSMPSQRFRRMRRSKPPLPKGGCSSAHTGAGGYAFSCQVQPWGRTRALRLARIPFLPRREQSPNRSASRLVILSERSKSKDLAPGVGSVSLDALMHPTRRRRDPSRMLRMTKGDRLRWMMSSVSSVGATFAVARRLPLPRGGERCREATERGRPSTSQSRPSSPARPKPSPRTGKVARSAR